MIDAPIGGANETTPDLASPELNVTDADPADTVPAPADGAPAAAVANPHEAAAGPADTSPASAVSNADSTAAAAGPAETNPGIVEAPPGPAPAPLREPDDAALRLAEAAVFASVTPMTARALSQILPDDMDAAAVIVALRERHAGRGIELVEIGGGLQFRTAADLTPQLRKIVQVPRRLPRVALETLAIVAYHQPVTRPEIEEIRGASLSQQTLDALLENDLIVARGRKETPGRPTLWGTTPKFLEYFGLGDIRELPRRQDLLLETVRPEAVRTEDVTESATSAAETTGEPDPAGS